jgi:hypothetical protein
MKTENKYTLGKCDYNGDGRQNCTAKLTWTLEDRDGKIRFSMSGEIWQPTGRDILAGGQCVDTVTALFPNDPKAQRMAEIWRRWHLNDMRPGCEHQREWNTEKKIAVTRYTWGEKFHATRKQAEAGTLAVLDYSAWKELSARVMRVTINSDAPKYPEHHEVKALLEAGWIKPEKTETRGAGWIRPVEHPEGLLCKPCPVCGYKYGSAWNYEAIPPEILDEIRSW